MLEIKTEDDWNNAPDVQALLEFPALQLTEREERQFVLACCNSLVGQFAQSPYSINDLLSEWIGDLQKLVDSQPVRDISHLLVERSSLAQLDQLVKFTNPKTYLFNAIHTSLFQKERLAEYTELIKVKQLNKNLMVYIPEALESWNYLIYTSINVAHVAVELEYQSLGADIKVTHSLTEELLGKFFFEHAQIFRRVVGNPFREGRANVWELVQTG